MDNRISEDIKIWVICGDAHAKYHSVRTINVMLNICDHLVSRYDKIDYFIMNGDLADCYAISRFDKDPERVLGAQKEYDLAKDIIARISSALPPVTQKIFIKGNHEHRFTKEKWRNPQLYTSSYKCFYR